MWADAWAVDRIELRGRAKGVVYLQEGLRILFSSFLRAKASSAIASTDLPKLGIGPALERMRRTLPYLVVDFS
jgi:hypothetical protein